MRKHEEFLILESEGDYFSPTNNIRFEKIDSQKLEEMNFLLEEQKKISRKKFIYETFCNMINEKLGNHLWNRNDQNIDDQEEYEAIYKHDQLKESCFLGIVEMTNLEKAFVNLTSVRKKSFRYKATNIILRIRKYIIF